MITNNVKMTYTQVPAGREPTREHNKSSTLAVQVCRFNHSFKTSRKYISKAEAYHHIEESIVAVSRHTFQAILKYDIPSSGLQRLHVKKKTATNCPGHLLLEAPKHIQVRSCWVFKALKCWHQSQILF